MTSLVSVIMPCYNAASYVRQSVTSVLNQTHSILELLIVDDGSTDDSADIIQDLCEKDDRIRFIKSEQNQGVAQARNKALTQAKGRFLAFLDADDLWRCDKLEQQLDFMLRQRIGFCYTAYDCIDSAGKSLRNVIQTAGNLDYQSYLKNTIIGCSTVMIDTDIVGKIVMPGFRTSEDFATWLIILKKGFSAYALNTVLTSYRIRPHSVSANKWKAACDVWSVYRKQEGFKRLKAFRYFCQYMLNAIHKRIL